MTSFSKIDPILTAFLERRRSLRLQTRWKDEECRELWAEGEGGHAYSISVQFGVDERIDVFVFDWDPHDGSLKRRADLVSLGPLELGRILDDAYSQIESWMSEGGDSPRVESRGEPIPQSCWFPQVVHQKTEESERLRRRYGAAEHRAISFRRDPSEDWVSVHGVAIGERAPGRPVIIAGVGHGYIRLWDFAPGDFVGERLRVHRPYIHSVAAATTVDGQALFVSGGEKPELQVRDLATRDCLWKKEGDDAVLCVVIGSTAERRHIVVSGRGKTIHAWDLRTGEPLGTVIQSDTLVISLASGVTSDGRTVIVARGSSGTIRRWDLQTGQSLAMEPTQGTRCPGQAVVVGTTADGRAVVVSTCGTDHEHVGVWDLTSGCLVRVSREGHVRGIKSLALVKRASGQLIIVSGSVDEIRTWDAESVEAISDPLLAEDFMGVTSLTARISEHGGVQVVSGDMDGMIRIWNVVER